MLVIYSTADRLTILSKLGSVICQYQQVPIEFATTTEELQVLLPAAKAVFSLGANALESLQALGGIPKNRKVTGLRRQVLKLAGGTPLMVSYSPSISELDYGQFVDLQTDTSAVLRLADTGSTAPKYGAYKYIPNLQEVVQAVRAKTEQGETVELAFDTETLGLDRFHPEGYIISLQFSWEVGTGCMVLFKSKVEATEFLLNIENQADLNWLLNCPQISLRGANAKYDTEWVYEQTGITCTNLKFDTTLVGSILDENRSNGLDVHAKIYAPELGGYSDEFDQQADKSRMDLEYLKSPEKFLLYSAGDADATLRVAKAEKKLLLEDPALAGFYVNVLHPAGRAFEIVERGGVVVDKHEFDLLEADLIADLHRLIIRGKSIIGGVLAAKHYDPDKNGGINLTKASLINDFMFSPQGLNLKPKMRTEKTNAPVTSMEHLEMFKDNPEAAEFVGLMSEFSSTSKTLGTYIVGFKRFIRSDGRMHPSYWLHRGNRADGDGGTTTGRLSVTDPAFQCLVGSSLVLSDKGHLPILDIVLQCEQGSTFKVLTHNGTWQSVVGVYRNGVQPLLKVTTKAGRSLTCTHNHPWLTSEGFVQAGKLCVGDTVWGLTDESIRRSTGGTLDVSAGFGTYRETPQVPMSMRVRDAEGNSSRQPEKWQESILRVSAEGRSDQARAQQSDPDHAILRGMEKHEGQMLSPKLRWVQALRWSWNNSLQRVAGFIRHLFEGYGGTTARYVFGQGEREFGLLRKQLQMGYAGGAGAKQDEQRVVGVRRGYPDRNGLGQTVRPESRGARKQTSKRVESDSGPHHSNEASQAGFEQDTIVSIEVAPAEETFDLTIEDSHSFVANGIVVHNTIPKHTTWGKRIRKCYTAPPGMLVLENDYSQGELKVMACLAHEDAMIKAYMNGMDLHVVTSGGVAGLSYEQMMALKKSDKEKYDAIRQLGKAGNFGLIYGMGVDGFIEYARLNYGVALSYEEAEKFRTGFFNTYPMLIQYHKQYKAFAHKHGYVRGPMGRVRHLPLINSQRKDVQAQEERRSINSPVQGTLSDMMIWAIAEQHKMGWFDTTPCFGSIHDAGYYYIPEDNAEFYAKRTVQVMENLPFHKVGWNPQLKFTADAKIGPSMGVLTELKF